jgi:pyruvate dehydrogenase E2 component (dihydrolipoamide acetyltransferase)
MLKITMPQAGQTMEEGIILSWRKAEGDRVEKGEVLLEIETDKATVEVEAAESGILSKILCPEGLTVPVLSPIAILANSGEDTRKAILEATAELKCMLSGNPAALEAIALPDMTNHAVASHKSIQGAPKTGELDAVPSKGGMPGKASPAARRMARERGIDLAELGLGSGPGGRILSKDLEKAQAPESGIRRPLTGMRRAIARNLQLSKQTIPHFYVRLKIDAAPLQAFCREQKARYSCTVNDVIVWVCARALREFPAFRCRIEGEEIVEVPGISIGIAVGMDDGLRVPVILDADRMSLKGVADESRRVIEAARHGKMDGLGRAVLTISNLGMFGVEEFAAIINPPEAAILAVGAIREEVLVEAGAMRAGHVMTMTLSADHRVVDGVIAAKFLRRLKELLEAPASLDT